ncbi:MAG: formate/nitrite transporter family protein [Gemmatimonadaceae bacterium]
MSNIPETHHASPVTSSESKEQPDQPKATPAERARRGDSQAQQDHQARQRRQVSAGVVHEAIRFEGEEELDRTSSALFWSGLAAGLTMGLSLLTQGLLRTALPDAPWRVLIESFGYTIGFVFVVGARQQLFTENTLTPILPLLENKSRLPDVARLWAIVLVANMLGAAVFAWVAANTSVFQPEVRASFSEIAKHVIEPGSGALLIRAVAAGWLIALMVWLLPAAQYSRLAMIILPTYVISLGGLTHSIAGSVDVLYLVATGEAAWLEFARFASLALLGNILGGVTLVAVLNHAQVVAGKNDEKEDEKRGANR